MANVCFQIETTRDISRQILRHRSFHFQEFSQRYAEVEQPHTLREPRIQHPTNRQLSLPLTDPETDIGAWFYDAQEELIGHAWHIYRKALKQGIAKEQARALLPEGLAPTTMHMNGTVRDWIHYTTLRCAEGTQPEHREVACAIDEILEQLLPLTWEAVWEYRNGYD